MIENSAHVQDESTHGPHQNNEFLDSFQRSCRKHLSFSKNGGLSGCVQQATAERRQRQDINKLSDEAIKLENCRRKIREMLLEKDLDEIRAAEEEVDVQNPECDIDTALPNTSLDSNNEDQNDMPMYMKSSDTTFDNFFRNKKRDAQRSSLRFYSLKDNDTNVQQRLESLLNSYVKQ